MNVSMSLEMEDTLGSTDDSGILGWSSPIPDSGSVVTGLATGIPD